MGQAAYTGTEYRRGEIRCKLEGTFSCQAVNTFE